MEVGATAGAGAREDSLSGRRSVLVVEDEYFLQADLETATPGLPSTVWLQAKTRWRSLLVATPPTHWSPMFAKTAVLTQGALPE